MPLNSHFWRRTSRRTAGEVVVVLCHRRLLLNHLGEFFRGDFASCESRSAFFSTSRFTSNGSGTRLPFSKWITVLGLGDL